MAIVLPSYEAGHLAGLVAHVARQIFLQLR